MGKAQEEKISAKLKSWKEEVEAQVSSGLSVSEWCRLNDIPTRNYYYHRQKAPEFSLSFNVEQPENREVVPISEISRSQIEALSATMAVIRKDGLEVVLIKCLNLLYKIFPQKKAKNSLIQ